MQKARWAEQLVNQALPVDLFMRAQLLTCKGHTLTCSAAPSSVPFRCTCGSSQRTTSQPLALTVLTIPAGSVKPAGSRLWPAHRSGRWAQQGKGTAQNGGRCGSFGQWQ